MENTEEKLNPCPFCGEEKELAVLFFPHELTFFVECQRCEARGGKVRTQMVWGNCETSKGEALAIKWWNRRNGR